MFIECLRYDLTNEIPLDIHVLLQAGPHPATGVDHGLTVEVGEHLHDRVDEGLLSILRGPLSVPQPRPTQKSTRFRSGELWDDTYPQGLRI